jgi:hypothetical protein
MGQSHNLQGRLFSATPYFRQSIPAAPSEVDAEAAADDAFMQKLMRREDRGTHLRMFEQAGVLARSPSDERPHGRDPKEWIANKVKEAKTQAPTGSGVPASAGENTTYESVRKHGVQTPVLVTQGDNGDGSPHYSLQHGHHRVYSAAEQNPAQEVPLVHTYSRYGGERWRPENEKTSQAASHQSMGGEYVEGGWTDPTTAKRHFLLT